MSPHVPPLEDVRSDVSYECKMIQARELAEKAMVAGRRAAQAKRGHNEGRDRRWLSRVDDPADREKTDARQGR